MSQSSDEKHAARLVQRVDDLVHYRALLIDQASQVLVDRYDLTIDQALTFLDEKAHEDDRAAADVAEEIVKGQRANPARPDTAAG